MLTRKKSLRDYSRDKKLREGKPLFTPRQATGLKRKGAAGRPSKPQEGIQPVRKPRMGLKRVSSKRAKENREYSERRKEFLENHPFCPVMWALNALRVPTTDIHHLHSRRGKWLNDTRYWMAVSRDGHDWIHQNGKAARARGWIIDRP